MFLIIHNPLSSNMKSKIKTFMMVRFFKKNHIPFNLRSTLKIDNLNEYLDNNPSITDVLFLGGDGSINHLINNVDVTKIKQTIYLGKSGSGNDFLRSLKKIGSGNITIGEAVTDKGSTKFINGVGAGIDATVCYYVNRDKKKKRMSYFKNVFSAMKAFSPSAVDISIDGKEYHYDKCYFAAIQNGEYFGGGMRVAPNADILSDEYRICVAHSMSKSMLQFLLMTIYSGLHVHFKKWVTLFTGKDITVKFADKRYFQAEGEVMVDVSEFSVKKNMSKEFHAFDKRKIKKSLVK
ncbi:MAG TPA: diacylglycerol kinase family protein [Bacillota bacterium]|nr:diacylglycerol kinase family protein [Bacillota bacterium]HPF42063.1 diacylglycerol kinase family protein [Bacillota bacterium]HPJ85785.1 diacylglycerol kinase family protein [Bacillota bacterium]HPQ61510.1 diacylglycerol kinase family protein [Bacillota bacterium]